MTPFRQKVGTQTIALTGGGLSMFTKNLGRAIGDVVPSGKPSEFDGDGDGFVTGPDGRDNIPATKPVRDAISALWSDKRQKALEVDEQRVISVAKKLRGREPKYDVARMRDLIVNARNREDAIAARKLTRDWAKSIFEVDGLGADGGYKVRLFSGTTGVNIMGRQRGVLAAHDEHPYLHVRISGEIVDKDGVNVGLFERHIYLDNENPNREPYVYHEVLRIKDEYKNKGIGSDFTTASEAMYSKMGIKSIELNAGLSDGAYTWLRAGYGFKDDDGRIKLAKMLEARYKEMLRDAGSKEKLVAGGFMTAVGRHFSDSSKPGTPAKMPEPFLESMEDLDKFLKLLGQLKTHPVGSEKELPPSALTLFGPFSRRILRGANFDVKKDVRSFPVGEKSLQILGLDKLFTRV